MPANKKRIILIVLKWLVVFASLFFIASRLNDSVQILNNFNFKKIGLVEFLFLVVALLLVLVNWTLEALKWKTLLKNHINISLNFALKGVVSGLATAIFTPNRVGEYFGRSVVLDKKFYPAGVIATITCSLAQIIITLIPGIVAFGLLFVYFPNMSQKIDIPLWLVISVSIIAAIIIVFFYLNLTKLGFLLSKLPFGEKYRELTNNAFSYSRFLLVKVLGLGALRYLVFVGQYFLLLNFFQVEITWYHALISISAGYFVMLVIPVFTFAEAGLRGAVALFFMEMVSADTVGIVSAAVLLWIINLGIPALFGSFVIAKIKVKNHGKFST